MIFHREKQYPNHPNCVPSKTIKKRKKVSDSLKVEPYETLRFWVTSESVSGKRYLVDFNKDGLPCDCPDHISRKRVCKHQRAVKAWMAEKWIEHEQAKEDQQPIKKYGRKA